MCNVVLLSYGSVLGGGGSSKQVSNFGHQMSLAGISQYIWVHRGSINPNPAVTNYSLSSYDCHCLLKLIKGLLYKNARNNNSCQSIYHCENVMIMTL